MVDLLDEIQDDLKEEKVLAAVKKYGKLLATAFIAVVIGFSLKLWWNEYKANQSYKEGAEFVNAIKKAQANKLEEAVKDLEILADNGKTNYAGLAKLHLAAYNLNNGNYAKAEALYQEVAAKDIAKEIKDYAQLMKLRLTLSSEKPNYEAAQDALTTYINSNPVFKYSAIELLALAEMQTKDSNKSSKTLQVSVDAPDAPQSNRERAAQLAKVTS